MVTAFRLHRRFVAMTALVGCLGLVAAALAFGDAAGTQFRITNQGHDGDTSYYARFQDTAYDSQTNQYLVVFFNQDELAGGQIQGQFVDAAGNLVGSAFGISPLGVPE